MALKGAASMIAKIRQIADKFPDRVAAALYTESQLIMTEAKKRTPVAPDGGTLRASGMVHKPERDGKNISVEMSFGGAADAYAIAVHEHLSEYSPPSWVAAELSGKGINWNADGTGPQFLSEPINEAMPHLAANLAKRLKL